jgi:S-adenosylmethionine decarboxylase
MLFRPPLSSWVGVASTAALFWEASTNMAQRKQRLAAIAGGQALKPRVPAQAQAMPVHEDADHFITRDGVTFAGHHLIIDLWEAKGLDDKARIEQAMRDAVEAAGATLLHIHLHTFTPNGGISGVAVLAESHISVHTWPERGYAAFDVFMCGGAEPKKALKVLEQAFAPKRVVVGIHKRGVL